MTAPVALAIDGIRIQYGPSVAVDGLSLNVNRGEVIALLGPNGSGKSSTLMAAAGVIVPAVGTVTVDGFRRRLDPEAYAARVGLVPQEPALYEELTAEANLAFVGRLYGLAGERLRDRVAWGLDFAKLASRRRDRVSTFSGGLKQRLNLVCALLHDPIVLLLDEPTAALDPASRDSLFTELHELRDRGHAVLLTTHHLDEAEQGCDRIAVLDCGKLVAEGKPAELTRTCPGGRAVLYAHLRDRLPAFLCCGLQRRVESGVEIEVTGRRLRLSAETSEALGRALALVLADGIALDSYRTPPGRLEALLRGPLQETPCDVI